MLNIEILTPGDKLKNIRKKYKLKQAEISCGDMSRNLISLIENNKTPLTQSAAKIIVTNINTILKDKMIDYQITCEELLESTTEQINKIINNFITEINMNKSNKFYNISLSFKNIEPYLQQYASSDKKAEVFKEIGNYYLLNKNFSKSYIYYFKAYEHIDIEKNQNEYVKIIINLSTCYYKLGKFEEVIELIDNLEKQKLTIDSSYRYKLLFNKSESYRAMNLFKNALETINTIETMSLSSTEIFEINTLKAINYNSLKLYQKSLDLHQKLFNKTPNSETTKKLVIICNIIEVYKKLNDIKSINKYLKISQSYLNEYSINSDSYYSNLIFYNLGSAAMFVSNNELAINLLNETLNWSKENNSYNLMFNCINDLFTIYNNQNMKDKLFKLKTSLLELLSKDNKLKYHKLIYKYLYIFNKNNQIDDSIGLIQFVLNLD